MKAAHERGALVVTPASMGVGLLEFHQFDVMVRAGRDAARALLESGELPGSSAAIPDPPVVPVEGLAG